MNARTTHTDRHAAQSTTQLTKRARKRTKLVATIGPACDEPGVLRQMFHHGMNVARLNMSHGSHADHGERVRKLREIGAELERPVAILADLQGPKIRTGRLKDGLPVAWVTGKQTVITVADCPEGDAERVGCTYKGLAGDVEPGSLLLVDDGRMRLRVDEVEGEDIRCTIMVGGILKPLKGINLPGVRVSAPSLSDKDKSDLAWAIANEVDYIALSFVRTARDVRNLKHRIAECGRMIPVIAKIEKPEAVENIDEILAEADGIMVARGDLGIEISTERLPVVQKKLIHAANRLGKPVITATQMLESMTENPIPTRAETSDVANAIFDGTDAVMLSGETAFGKYPVEAVAEMMRISMEAEKSPYMPATVLDTRAQTFDHFSQALTAAADLLARELPANAMLVFSSGSEKALLLSKRRGQLPIVACCHDERTWRRLSLFWGTVPVMIPAREDPQDLLEAGVDEAMRQGVVRDGDTLVTLFSFGEAAGNAIRVHHV